MAEIEMVDVEACSLVSGSAEPEGAEPEGTAVVDVEACNHVSGSAEPEGAEPDGTARPPFLRFLALLPINLALLPILLLLWLPRILVGSGSGSVLVIILRSVMVTILFSVSLFAYLYIYIKDDAASLVVEAVVYAAFGWLYVLHPSCWQKFIFAGYLVLVLSVFLHSDGIILNVRQRQPDDLVHAVFGANMAAVTTYCVWQFSFILPTGRSLKKVMAAIVTILLALIIIGFYLIPEHDSSHRDLACLVQLVAYNAVGCLGICRFPSLEEKLKAAGFLVFLLFSAFLLSASTETDHRARNIFLANIGALSSYCFASLGDLLGRRAREPARQEEAVPLLQEMLREFSSDEIRAMTQDFTNMIGQGGFAQVFRGNLGDGTPVAVKRMKANSGHTLAAEEDFRRELSVIASVHHRSLVRLLGYCLQRGGGLYLVYPFFENGSLDRWIFHGSELQRCQLTWPKRRCIAVDVARALAYLHNECHRRILHLDIKPGNILLDGDLRAHVSDFGISLSITRGVPSVINTRGRGTLGYMAPEMLFNSVSDRSDVFSYGKTILELVGGRPNYVAPVTSAEDASSSATPEPDLQRDYFPYIVRDMMTRGELLKAVDGAMAHDGVDEEEVKTVVEVALCCIQEQPDKRPRMQDVVDMLEGRVSVNLPPGSHPTSAVNFLDSVSSADEFYSLSFRRS